MKRQFIDSLSDEAARRKNYEQRLVEATVATDRVYLSYPKLKQYYKMNCVAKSAYEEPDENRGTRVSSKVLID